MTKKNILLFTIILSLSLSASYAQNPYGDWYGKIKTFQLNLVFHITQEGKKTVLKWDSPDQKAFGVEGDIALRKNNKIEISVKKIQMTYTGEYFEDSLVGEFKQGDFSESLVFYRNANKLSVPQRPQEPKAPFPYEVEGVKFYNTKDSIRLSGTFTKPKVKGRFPAVILVSGSGPQNRDEEIMGHKPFLVIADHLSKAGYGVLRYDDRGTFASEGTFGGATTFDFANDAEAAYTYLSNHDQVNRDEIFIIGHSEGGMIANILGAQIPNLRGIVSLAGTSIRGDSILEIQNALINKSNGMDEYQISIFQSFNKELYRAVLTSQNKDELNISIQPIVEKWKKILVRKKLISKKEKKGLEKSILERLQDPWLYSFIKYSPSKHISTIACHVLVLIGSKDIQVTSLENINNYKKLLPTNGKTHSILELDGLNHFFQKCQQCSIPEYGDLEETFSPIALEEIVKFLDEIVK